MDKVVLALCEAFVGRPHVRELWLRADYALVKAHRGDRLGMSGARIVRTTAIELQLTNKRRALATMCIGVGQGIAVALEKT